LEHEYPAHDEHQGRYGRADFEHFSNGWMTF
jgi:hypothetical protein